VRPRIKTVAVFVWSLAVWSATGCATGARYVRPAPPTQTKYLPPATARLAGNAAAAAPHVTMGSGPPQRWWTLLGSDDIDRLVMRALQNNQSLAGAKAHLAAAREQLRAARGAWYPQVDAAAGAQRTRFGATVLGPLAKDFPPFSAYAAGAEVSYDIDVFGGTRSHVEQTAAAEQYRSAQLGAVALSVSGNVVIQVLQIATLRAQIRVAEQIVADDEHTLDLLRAAREAGAVSGMDVLSSQSQLDHDRTLLPPLHQELSEAQDALAVLLGVAPSDAAATNVELDALKLADDLPPAGHRRGRGAAACGRRLSRRCHRQPVSEIYSDRQSRRGRAVRRRTVGDRLESLGRTDGADFPRRRAQGRTTSRAR
jgi:outer membrane protein TolC